MASPNAPLVLHVVHSLEGGGTERALVSLLRAFDYGQMRHAVVTLRHAGSLAARLPDEVACVAMRTVGRSRTSGFRLAHICARLRPSIIHARNVCTWPDAAVAGVLNPRSKLVLGFHGLEGGGHFSRRDRHAARFAKAFGARFTSVSEFSKLQMIDEFRLPREQVDVLANGVDLARFASHGPSDRNRVRESFGFQPSHRVIGIVGSLTSVKGHDVLLSAIANVVRKRPQVRLLVVGDGPLRGNLEARAAKLGILNSVHFAGWREDVPMLLGAMDVHVSASRSEGMSNALLEAMAAGLPVVSTAVGDHSQVVRHGVDGLLVRPQNVPALTEAIETIMDAPERAAVMGRSARARVEAYGFERMVDAYQCYYFDLLKPAPNTAPTLASVCRRLSKSVIGAFPPRVITGTPVK